MVILRTMAAGRAEHERKCRAYRNALCCVHHSVSILDCFHPCSPPGKHEHPVVAGALGPFASSNLRTVFAGNSSDLGEISAETSPDSCSAGFHCGSGEAGTERASLSPGLGWGRAARPAKPLLRASPKILASFPSLPLSAALLGYVLPWGRSAIAHMAKIHSPRSAEGRGGHRNSSWMVRPGNFGDEARKCSRQIIALDYYDRAEGTVCV